MSFANGWGSVFKILRVAGISGAFVCAFLAGVGVNYLWGLTASERATLWFDALSSLFSSNAIWVLAGLVLGLIPGMILNAYAHFKAMTRYFRDTPELVAKKAATTAEEKRHAHSEAYIRFKVAKRAVADAERDLVRAKNDANSARAAAQKDVDQPQKVSLDSAAAEKTKLEKATRERLRAAKMERTRAEHLSNVTFEAKQVAEQALTEALAALKAEAESRTASDVDIAKAKADAKAEAANSVATAKEAADKALAAKANAEAAKTMAQQAATKSRENPSDATAKTDADEKQKLADQQVALANEAREQEAKLAEEAEKKAAKWRALVLNPTGLKRTTLEKAERIREDETGELNRLAMVLTVICWVSFTVCWSGLLNVLSEVQNAQVALQLGCAGAYVYVLTILGRRSFQQDITPSSVLWCCVTMALGPVLSLVLAYIWIGSQPSTNVLGPVNDKAIFFFAGLAPRHLTALLLEILRRVILALNGRPTLNLRSIPLQQIRGITPETEERLEEEGILDVVNLAMADPLRLLRNTSFDKFQILTWIDEALLMYTFPQQWQALENEGITGVMDVAWYVACLPDSEKLAKQVKIDPENFKKIIERLAEDAQVQLIWILYDLDNPNE